jgi:hypothetical protein
MLVICVLTAIIYPIMYGQILSEQIDGLTVLTLRNLLVFSLWAATSWQLVTLARQAKRKPPG